MNEHSHHVTRIVRLALEEDLGAGDITTDAVVGPDVQGRAVLTAKEQAVLAGLDVFTEVFGHVSGEVRWEHSFSDGDLVPSGATVCVLSGPLAPMLKAERTALNLLQRMSGIATLTRKYVEQVSPFEVKILDTRKTSPGLRVLDKYAVRVGGGANHRFGLFDGVLIKDNHIAAAGSISQAVARARRRAPHTLKVEVEVEDLASAREAVQAGADALLLDNMTPDRLKEACALFKGQVLLEASGGIDLASVAAAAETGVDVISVGALTHSVKAIDFSLNMECPEKGRSDPEVAHC